MIREKLHNTRMISTAIIGTAGYTGQETLDRVLAHPELELVALGSDTFAGKPAERARPADRAHARSPSSSWSRTSRRSRAAPS